MGDEFPVGGAHGYPIQKGARLRHRPVWVVGGEHDPAGADLKEEVEECLSKVKKRFTDIKALFAGRADILR
jgi:hypothetical protein